MDPRERLYIESLYLEMYEKLVYYANLTLRNSALSEEAVQETFCIACLNAHRICASENPHGWLFTALRHVLQNMRREQTYSKRYLSGYLLRQGRERSFSEDRFHPEILYGDLAATDEFQLLWKMAVENMSHKELALELGITVEACKKRVQRAKKVLHRKMKL